MDYYEILFYLTTIDKTEAGPINDFNERLQQILQKVQTISMKNNGKLKIDTVDNKNEPNDIRYQYICTIVHVLQNIKINNSANDESLYSVQQFRTLKASVELITAIGIISCLLPGVGVDMAKTCPKALLICKEELTDLQRYKRLKFTVNSLIQLYDDIMFRPAILIQIGPLLAALLQLCHAPLMKPSKEATSIREGNANKDKFIMTADLYDELKKDQEHFACLFHKLLNKCPSSTCMKELMVILGITEAPKWLRRETRKYLVEQLMQSNGIVSIIAVVCEDVLDLGEHWDKLDIISRLIVTSHGINADQYYKSICLQLLSLLTSTQIKHSTTIANCCITALYEYNSNVCYKNIVAVMCDPLLVNSENEQKVKSEEEVERCIEKLTKCFVVTEALFKRLPCQLLMNVAVPLFSLYNDIRQSACVLKSKLKQLVLLLLYEESTRNDLFGVLLGHNLTNNFGNRLETKFGLTGGIEIVGIDKKTCKYEEFADTLFDTIFTTEVLSTELFSYLLKYLSNSMKLDQKEDQSVLETENDLMEKIEEKLAAVKLLSNLANISAVQEAQIEDPKLLMYFIKSLFNQYIGRRLQIHQNSPEEDDCEILYVGLMLMKMILSERKKPLDWTVFSDFVKFLKECCVSNISSQLLLLIRELIALIESQGKSERKQYQDLSVNRKVSNKFEEALKDLADPLLPVRAHGLVILTKLIENMDPCAIARKMVLLQLFNENLKHEDSFIYLAAINGLCALATSYPQVVVETLVKEYIDMPQRVSAEEITTETRVKLGEVLVKMTRNLGEMAPAYKNILINGFLCAARDTNSLVRASSLSCLGELCKVLGFHLGDIVIEIIYCISCIVKTDKAPECRRAAVMISTLLFRGLGKSTLTSMDRNLVDLYRGLKYLRDNDEDLVLRLHAQLALEELDSIVQDFLLSSSKLEKRIIL
ncbi:uncharacterized protein LOC122535335 isoform X2 [Frieseomelitta varia]|uniref:uncharacterized protein LOC122535335 isoform X2 n=1 Tax=Frieseomelitta varia TaxID=561572 RepID=UPI001CB69F87|nr:uncharacterized protein LOC122535335 isoform X2 [Frieseomelitta varia]